VTSEVSSQRKENLALTLRFESMCSWDRGFQIRGDDRSIMELEDGEVPMALPGRGRMLKAENTYYTILISD
jgi:hypothetical protein